MYEDSHRLEIVLVSFINFIPFNSLYLFIRFLHKKAIKFSDNMCITCKLFIEICVHNSVKCFKQNSLQ